MVDRCGEAQEGEDFRGILINSDMGGGNKEIWNKKSETTEKKIHRWSPPNKKPYNMEEISKGRRFYSRKYTDSQQMNTGRLVK